MDIGWAVDCLKDGDLVQRAGWNGKGMYLFLQDVWPDCEVLDWLPFVVMVTVTGQVVPWLCSQTDLLAEDWQIFEETL